MFQRVLGGDVGAALGDRHHQFDLVAELVGLGREGQFALGCDHIAGGLHEEHRLARRRVGGLGPGIVAAQAEHPPDREARIAATNRQADEGGWSEQVAHG
ncbi:hypothetical protein D3C80_1707600 [compost metagenome]